MLKAIVPANFTKKERIRIPESTIKEIERLNSLDVEILNMLGIYSSNKGFGINEKAVINILAHRGVYRRKMIKETYEKMYNENLLKRLESELTRKFERAMLLWMLEPAECDVFLAHKAIKKWSPKDTVRIEIFCSRSPSELLLMRKAYHLKYKKSVEEDIASHTTGDF